MLNRIFKDVDTSFANLKNIEQRITDCERQITSLPNEIKAVQTSVDRLLQNGPKITEAANKIQNMDALLADTEKRMGELSSASGGMNKAMLDLEKLKQETDGKIELVRTISVDDSKKGKASADKTLSPQIREAVRQLKRQGWSIQEIASKLKRSENEVELILEIPE